MVMESVMELDNSHPRFTLYRLDDSPNNLCVQLVLDYLELQFNSELVDPEDRSELNLLSGQPLTPVLVDTQRDVILSNSYAIMLYLEANYRNTEKPLFTSHFATMTEIEAWERFTNQDLARSVSIAVREYRNKKNRDPFTTAEAAETIYHDTEVIERRLENQEWLVGEQVSAADFRVASMVSFAVSDIFTNRTRLREALSKKFVLGRDREATRDWVRRVIRLSDYLSKKLIGD